MMRHLMGCTMAFVFAVASANGQDGQPAKLQTFLEAWEKSRNATIIVANLDCRIVTKTSKEDWKGFLVYQPAEKARPRRAQWELSELNGPAKEKHVVVGDLVHEFMPQKQLMRTHNLQQDGVRPAGILMLALDADVKVLRACFDIELKGSDEHYHYLRLVPNRPIDRLQTSEVRLSLLRTSHLPNQLWMGQPGGVETTWNITRPRTVPQLPGLVQFNVALPQGWRIERPRGVGAN